MTTRDQYAAIVSNPPANGTILKTIDSTAATLYVQTEDDKQPFIFGLAYVHEAMDDNVGWYLRSHDDPKQVGWKCILMSAARRDVIKNFPEQFAQGSILVRSLRVIRPSKSGNSLLCEVCSHYIEYVELNDMLPIEFDRTSDNYEQRGLEQLKASNWKIGAPKDGVYENCITPNGVRVHLVIQ